MVANRNFDTIINKMPGYLQELKKCPCIRMDDAPERRSLGSKLPESNAGIYALYEVGKPLYVGRSNRLKERLLEHGLKGNGRESATFAFLLAKEVFQEKHPDTQLPPRRDLVHRPDFAPLFAEAKTRIRKMKVRAVSIQDPIEQTIFEVYAHLALKTPYNSFENH